MWQLSRTLLAMTFTALHRGTGTEPGPITNDLLDQAVRAGLLECEDLDWKSKLPPMKYLSNSDFPKDVAAFANRGGGVIVYGVKEAEKAATKRVDTGPLTESHERALRTAAMNAVTPPVRGLKIHRLERNGLHAVVIEVPASPDRPHLIYRNELFGAPVREDADTFWMQERVIDAMYRERHQEQRDSEKSLGNLYDDAAHKRGKERAWLIAVARPRFPMPAPPLSRDAARNLFAAAKTLTLRFVSGAPAHPLESVDVLNPRPGLRGWVGRSTTGRQASWKEAWASVHNNGAVTLASSVGGHRSGRDRFEEPWQVFGDVIEAGVSDFMSLVRVVGNATSNDDYDVRVGIEWDGEEPLLVSSQDSFGEASYAGSTPLRRYIPVTATVDAAQSDRDFHDQVHRLIEDCVSQGGVFVRKATEPPPANANESGT